MRRYRYRGQGSIFILVLLLAVSLVAGVPYLVASESAKRPEAEESRTTLPLPAGVSLQGLQQAHVDLVIDGDTIEVTVAGKKERLRYFGVDTPERGDRCFREATDRNEQLVGSTVLLLPDGRDRDSFDRILRYVFLSDGTSVDATLVAEGFGHAWRKDGQYKDQIIVLETQADSDDRGCLWR